jgi:hypothetical protein
MADTNVIGSATDYTAFLGDAAAGSATYAWYMKPEQVEMQIATPESLKFIAELGINYAQQMGKLVVVFILKNIILTWANFENLKKALFYWSKGPASPKGGYLLYFNCYDVIGATHDMALIGTYTTPTTLAQFRTRIIDPIGIVPLPNGNYLVRELIIMNWNSSTAPT